MIAKRQISLNLFCLVEVCCLLRFMYVEQFVAAQNAGSLRSLNRMQLMMRSANI
jgi:hypothetical protein